ncbi:MAG: hypothetical protein IPJ34_31660 [Myxococcales bacterium]|nr:hypothetical protein [Myxococcales bacterium]
MGNGFGGGGGSLVGAAEGMVAVFGSGSGVVEVDEGADGAATSGVSRATGVASREQATRDIERTAAVARMP